MGPYIKQFKEISITDIGTVGGKNASLGEMSSKLSLGGIAIPGGFATTAFAFEEFLTYNSLHSPLYDLVLQLDKKNFSNLKEMTPNQFADYRIEPFFPKSIRSSKPERK